MCTLMLNQCLGINLPLILEVSMKHVCIFISLNSKIEVWCTTSDLGIHQELQQWRDVYMEPKNTLLKHLLCHWTIIIMGFNDVACFAPVQYSSSSAQLGVCGPVSCVLVCPCEVECRSVYIMVCRRPRFWCAMTTRALSAQRGLWEHSTASIPPWKVVECVLVWKKTPKKPKKSFICRHAPTSAFISLRTACVCLLHLWMLESGSRVWQRRS